MFCWSSSSVNLAISAAPELLCRRERRKIRRCSLSDRIDSPSFSDEPQEYEDALSKVDAVQVFVEIDIRLQGVSEALGYLVDLVENEQARTALLDGRLDRLDDLLLKKNDGSEFRMT